MQDAKVEARIRHKYRLVAVELDERRRRQWAAAEARDVGWGGISLVARATGLSRPTIMAGLKESGTFVEEPGGRRGTRAVSGWRTPETDPIRSGVAGGIGAVDRSRHARRPHVSVALDVQEHRQVGRGIDATESPRLGSHGRDAAEAEWLQLAGQPQDARRLVAPGPQRSVRVHQPAGDGRFRSSSNP